MTTPHDRARREVIDALPAEMLDQLDRDWDVPCEGIARGRPCEHPAEWIMWRVQCCPDVPLTVLACPVHELAALSSQSVACLACGHLFGRGGFAFTRIEPLNPRRAS